METKTLTLPITLVFLVAYVASCHSPPDTARLPVDYVDLLIGTATFSDDRYMGNNPVRESYYGCVVPGPRTPSGLVKLSPVTGFSGGYHTRGSGYRHTDTSIMGFTHLNHEYNLYANILFMPLTGNMQARPGTLDEPNSGYRSSKDYSAEVAAAGYYSVRLSDYDIRVELTVTDNCGFHRYSFPQSEEAKVLVDLSVSQKFTPVQDAEIAIEEDRFICGWQQCMDIEFNKGRRFKVFFFAEFNKPFAEFGTWKDDRILSNIKEQKGPKIGAYVGFKTHWRQQILVKVGVSFESIEDARAKIQREIPHWDFEQIARDTAGQWNNLLSRIEVKGGTEEQKTIFYTSLYRCLKPDNAADYYGPGVIQLLVYPQWIEKWLAKDNWPVSQGGFWASGYEPWLLGLYNRGMRSFDLEKAYESVRAGATDTSAGWIRLADYIQYGYIPYNESTRNYWDPNDYADVVSRTIGYSYTDYCIAQLARILNKNDDYEYFLRRSKSYLNLFDPNTGFFRPKNKDGSRVRPFDPTYPNVMRFYREGNAWQYLWFARHDTDTLIQLLGGRKAFIERLDQFFSIPFDPEEPVSDITGLIGQYCHGNETDRWVPYYYCLAGAPWKTQQTVREIMSKLHKATPDGLCGMDDNGTLSSWYVLSAIGFFPVNVSDGTYVLASPLFDQVTIHLANGNKFRVIARNNSEPNLYVESAKINGVGLNRCFIRHVEMVKGGELELQMGSSP